MHVHKQDICLYISVTEVRNDNGFWTMHCEQTLELFDFLNFFPMLFSSSQMYADVRFLTCAYL